MPLTIYRRGRFWWLTGTVRTKDGESSVHESTGETEEKKADAIRQSREREAHEALILGNKAIYTFGMAAEAYIDAGKDDRFLEPLIEHFRDTRISDLSGTKVRQAAKELYPDAAYTTWNRQVVTPMKAVINHSADAGDCPAIKIKGFSKRDRDVRLPDTAPRVAVTRDYIDRFRKHCDNPWVRALMLFNYQTAARISEALRVEPDDLDLPNRTVTLTRTKNGKERVAKLTAELVFELQDLKPRGDRVFGYRSKRAVYTVIQDVCARAKIPYLGTHQPGRHSFATELIVRKKLDVDTAAKLGGWDSRQLLVQTYVHGDAGEHIIEDAFGAKAPKVKKAKRKAA